MLKMFIIASATAVFLLGGYAEAKYHFTPEVSATLGTVWLLAGDFYSAALAGNMGKINPGPVIVAVGGFSALALFRYLFRAGRL